MWRPPTVQPHSHSDDGAAGAASDAQQLSRVRELLFGDANRALDARLDAMEARLEETAHSVRSEFASRVDALREELLKGLERTQAEVARERDERMTAVRELREELRAGLEAAEAANEGARTDLFERLSREGQERIEDLGERLDATASVLGQRIEAGDASLRRDLEAGLARLQAGSVDRQGLARDLASIAERLGAVADASAETRGHDGRRREERPARGAGAGRAARRRRRVARGAGGRRRVERRGRR